MRMKITAACMIVAAYAALAIAPALASATATLGETLNGEFSRIAVGQHFTGTNVGNVKFNFGGGGAVECTSVVLTGVLEANGDAASEGTIETASFKGTEAEERCSSNLGATKVTTNVGAGVPWCMTAFEKGMEVLIRGKSCPNKAQAITFVLDVTILGVPVECRYERNMAVGPMKGTFTTDAAPENSDAVIHIAAAGANFVGEAVNPGVCPANLSLEMSITLETDQTEAVPLYFR